LAINVNFPIIPAKGTSTFYTGQAQLNSLCSRYMKNFHGKFVEISVSDNGSVIDSIVAKRIIIWIEFWLS
jgi:hypothetical protein